MTSPRRTFTAMVLALGLIGLPMTTMAQDNVPDPPLLTEADSLDPFLWVARPVVVFADSPNDPFFIEQLTLLEQGKDALFERDVVVIADTNPAVMSEIRRKLRPRGFGLVLIGKDGRVELRKPAPWHVRELTRVIDKMPLRQQEIRDAQTSAGSG